MKFHENVKSWNWDAIAKIGAGLVTAVTIMTGVVQYRDQAERQYRQKVYDEQFTLYAEITTLAARLSTTPQDSVQSAAFVGMSTDFDYLYYGKSVMLGDSAVGRAMNQFKDAIEKYTAGTPEVGPREMKNCSTNLGLACRSSLARTQGMENLLY